MKKYVFVDLLIVNGEIENPSLSVHIVDETENIEDFAREQAKKVFAGEPTIDEDDPDYFGFFNDEVSVYVNSYKEITLDEFNVLSRFL